jgi:hypothetical protein
MQSGADTPFAQAEAQEEAGYNQATVSDEHRHRVEAEISKQTIRDGLLEATLNESDRRAENARLRGELERRDKVATEIRIWGALALTVVIAILSAVGTAFFYFDRKFAEHVASTNATEKATEKNKSDIEAIDVRTKANTLWIQDVQGEQKAFEQSQRTEGLKTTIEINNLRNDVTNLKGHR